MPLKDRAKPIPKPRLKLGEPIKQNGEKPELSKEPSTPKASWLVSNNRSSQFEVETTLTSDQLEMKILNSEKVCLYIHSIPLSLCH